MNIARSSLKLFVGNAGSSLIVFLGTAFFARVLTPQLVGIFFLFQALLGLLSIAADLGLRGSVEKRISEQDASNTIFGTGIVMKSVPLTIVSLLVWAVRNPVNDYLGAELVTPLLVALVLREAAELVIGVLRGQMRVGETGSLRFSYQVVWFLSAIILYRSGFGVYALVYGSIVGFVIMTLWGASKITTPVKYPSRTQAISLFEYARYNVVAHVGGYFYSWIDIAIIGLFFVQSAVGFYEVAWRVSLLVTLFSDALHETVFPKISEWETGGQLEELEQLIPSAIVASLFFSIPALFGSIIFARDILHYLFGTEYTIAWIVLIILMFEKNLQVMRGLFGNILRGLNKPRLEARATTVAVLSNIIFSFLLVGIPSVQGFGIQVGIVGAAVATLLSFGLHTAIEGYYVDQFINVQIPTKRLLWCVSASMLMAAVLYIMKLRLSIPSLPILLGYIAGGAVLYVAMVFTSETMRQDAMSVASDLR
jgi:O-antigen/teichoic acid export membrane protein